MLAVSERRFFPELAAYVVAAHRELRRIGEERRRRLGQLSRFISGRCREGRPARLVFICTHNSRRSHLAQIWAQTAAHLFRLAGVEPYSGGTESTAFNPRAVAALKRAGFRIDKHGEGDNPVYRVRYAEDAEPLECVSKLHGQPPNPCEGFCAVMTCSEADAACPVVVGASARISLPYDDPKDSDGTTLETERYDERCRQIAREMLYAFSCVSGC